MSTDENNKPASFHIDRMDAITLELWRAHSLDLHMCDGTVKTGQSGILDNIRVSWRNLAPLLKVSKPFMYGIMCPDGTAYFDEICVDSNDSQTLAEVIEEQELEGHKVVPLYLHPPSSTAKLHLACEGLADDYMTSEQHHPGWVLIPQTKFEAICAAIGETFMPEIVGTTYDGVNVLAPAVPSKNFTREDVAVAIARASDETISKK